ncbi:uncharacterized protein LOC107039131 [Diachasma alloeum]|uniref:uncharacterized protein LOC107039131 n=1 Tax=Diachasma alloeum TaxID=454923 RepID=UPI000738146D|nr:uncharacterized protein LOC107039131 [Diachasma alloeum]
MATSSFPFMESIAPKVESNGVSTVIGRAVNFMEFLMQDRTILPSRGLDSEPFACEEIALYTGDDGTSWDYGSDRLPDRDHRIPKLRLVGNDVEHLSKSLKYYNLPDYRD